MAVLAALVAELALLASSTRPDRAPATGAASPGITSAARFEGGIAPLFPQCAPATPSKPPRLRGTYAIETGIVGHGRGSLRITLPADSDPVTYPLEACDLITRALPIGLGTSAYYGLMVWVPAGWRIPNKAFFGVNIYELHFQNIYGAPVTLQLHPHHVTLAIQTGGCANHLTARPGCAWRSNADVPAHATPDLPAHYAIPPGAFVQGAWNEIVLHVLWSSTSSGQIQSYYRLKGGSAWRRSADITGIPTVQWDNATGCCAATYDNQIEAYTAALSTPMSVWLDDVLQGTSLHAVEAALP